jgi:hypothetical protein
MVRYALSPAQQGLAFTGSVAPLNAARLVSRHPCHD